MARFMTNGRRPLLIPGTAQRALRRPDPRGQVRDFCYELAQTDPGMPEERYFKAVRLIRLTRVPR